MALLNWKKANVDHELGRYDKLGAAAAMIPKSQLIELDDIGPSLRGF